MLQENDQGLEEYAAQGVYIPSLHHVPGFKFDEQSSFYWHKKEANVGVRSESDKDEIYEVAFLLACVWEFL